MFASGLGVSAGLPGLCLQVVNLSRAHELSSVGVEWKPYCWSEDLAKEFLGFQIGGMLGWRDSGTMMM